ncbi:hypothetical protein GCM10010872_41160 [Dyella flava]|nr:hypothetical protein GCM10010872_41160 [Dyella flava]
MQRLHFGIEYAQPPHFLRVIDFQHLQLADEFLHVRLILRAGRLASGGGCGGLGILSKSGKTR